MMRLEVERLTKTYAAHGGGPIAALAETSFAIGSGEFVSLLGPSGCGKSSLLQLIVGLEEASAGEIRLDGERIHGPGPDRGMVFQSYTLFPWLSVLENARFGAQLRCNRAADDAARTRTLLQLIGLADFCGAYPRELSGGMQQRVAIVRALANRPKLLAMDEPFGALDAQTRAEMQELTLLLHAHERTSVLFVTHDVEEAIYLSSRVLLLSARPGRIVRDVSVPFGPSLERTPELKLAPEFLQLKRELLELLHGSALRIDRRALLAKLVEPVSERT
jgi:ABC-type nitrate/sulfonate/bicarbonate transport system ATPase subunit